MQHQTIAIMRPGQKRTAGLTSALLAGLALGACSTSESPPPQASVPVTAVSPGIAAVQPAPGDAAFASAETIWALRGGLNVAALLCNNRSLTGNYNQMLKNHRGLFSEAYATEQARYRAQHGSAWQARHDAAMTRLYNGFANVSDRRRYCSMAGRVMADVLAMPSPQLAQSARRALLALDPDAPRLLVSAN
jgi:hypothetical protein